MRGVDGDALGAVRGGGVAGVDVLAHIGRGQRHRRGVRASVVRRGWRVAVAGGGDGEGAVGVGGGDGPQGAVADVPPVGEAQAAVVPPGEDPVAGPGVAADPAGGLVAERDGGPDHLAGGDAVGVGALVERGDGGVVGGDEQGGLAGVGVGLPRGVRGVEDRLGGAVGDPPVGGVARRGRWGRRCAGVGWRGLPSGG